MVRLVQQVVHGRAFGDPLRQEPGNQGPEPLVADPCEIGFGLDDVVHHRVLVAHPVGERKPAGRRVRQDAAEGEHVTLRAGTLAAYLFRSHEARRSDHHAGTGERFDRGLGRAGDAEVDDLGPLDGEHHVRGLQVPVDDACRVDVLERAQEPVREGEHGLGGEGAVAAHDLLQGETGHVPRGHPGELLVGGGVEDGRRVALPHAPRRVDLAPETDSELRVRDVFRVHHLHRDRAAALGTSQVDPAHATRPEPAEQEVGPNADRVGPGQRLDATVQVVLAAPVIGPVAVVHAGHGRALPRVSRPRSLPERL